MRKGQKHSEETRKKLSAAQSGENHYMYGKKHTEETRKKLSAAKIGENHPLYGKKRPEISGENHPMFGKKHSDESRKKMSAAQSGENNPMYGKTGENNPGWKGGISCEPYCPIWQDKEYKESIKIRDGHKCLNPECSGISSRICIHHINYDKKDCHPKNLITICQSCNTKANSQRSWHKSWYQAIIQKRGN